ncbi:hypothetical protein BU24DRAFT_435824 [Aaosphaeria arxii CBS 175.79]|uniref:MYND-type zinc finger protein samB n=1 Tax=Aaosphaeria arxii CBS 175.79 TaxID=1450172 RepID=A0A6A5XEM2_9PLEO|nr:uncharacterized protein BU24DRAFT_435824 [Aaosphaeria arxii CBS 175.79]KAF2011329.1 hypothetical protein BU24DRAFT_435824 [Aaosphaeria arxii CBS 175.79]
MNSCTQYIVDTHRYEEKKEDGLRAISLSTTPTPHNYSTPPLAVSEVLSLPSRSSPAIIRSLQTPSHRSRPLVSSSHPSSSPPPPSSTTTSVIIINLVLLIRSSHASLNPSNALLTTCNARSAVTLSPSLTLRIVTRPDLHDKTTRRRPIMREVNFSIPNANKASVGITTALYDRRALDCTSTLPLINSLNHLAYLTTSSARIRDILTVDGGIERLICILKEGRSKDMMDMWKWNLAFQCLFNIGVRGSESVRTRVVEADMVPVIATILDNYIKVVDKCREKAENELRRSTRLGASSRHHSSRSGEIASSSGHRTERSRRMVPPPIEIPQTFTPTFGQTPLESQAGDTTPTPAFSLSSPPERTTFARGRPSHHHHHRSHENRTQLFGTTSNSNNNTPRTVGPPLASALPTIETTPTDTFPLRPVRDADRLPSMLPSLQGEITSQPQSPTTPGGPHVRQNSPRASAGRGRRRPSIRHQQSLSGESDIDAQPEPDISAEVPAVAGTVVNEPIVGIQNDINMADMVENTEMLDPGATPVALAAPPSEGTDENHETFNITHRPALDGSLINPAATQTNAPIGGFSPVQPAINVVNANPPPPWHPRYAQDRNATAGVLAAMPRDEDVLMSLQLLAYVSKYCNLRAYFQQSHLVPKLKIGSDLQLLDGETPSPAPMAEEEELEEYELPDDFNIFPLVEKFTVRHHTSDMQYWASVVMRNLCRKDDARGGIRQCAYYQCGKWEEYTRQFAKCRRCRRTKYCSKECQKSAWVYHRHWCVAAVN